MPEEPVTVLISEINLYGNNKTRAGIILRELSVAPGSRVAADSMTALVTQNRLRLMTVGLFTDIDIRIDTISAAEVRWNIYLKERWYLIPEVSVQLADRNFNVWWKEQGRDIRRTILGVTLRHKNFRGALENLSLTAQVGYTKKFYIDYLKPYIDKKQRHGLGFSLGLSESQETFFATDSNKLRFVRSGSHYIIRQYEAAVAYTYRPAYAGRHLVRLGYKHLIAADTILELNPEYFAGGSRDLKHIELTYRYELNRTDNWNYPLKGVKLIGQVFNRIGIEGMHYQLLAGLEAADHRHLGGNWYTAAVFRGRIALPERQPYVLRAALGTRYEYVRGYEYYVIDGSQFGVGRMNLKYELLNKTVRNIPLKYLPAIPIRIYPKLFADAGYVKNELAGNSFLNNKWLYAGGAGIDIFTAYDMKIRLEYALNHLGQKGLFLHFSSE